MMVLDNYLYFSHFLAIWSIPSWMCSFFWGRVGHVIEIDGSFLRWLLCIQDELEWSDEKSWGVLCVMLVLVLKSRKEVTASRTAFLMYRDVTMRIFFVCRLLHSYLGCWALLGILLLFFMYEDTLQVSDGGSIQCNYTISQGVIQIGYMVYSFCCF